MTEPITQAVPRRSRAALETLIRQHPTMPGREMSRISGFEAGYCLLRRREILGLAPDPSKSAGAKAANSKRRTAKPAPEADAPAPRNWWDGVVA